MLSRQACMGLSITEGLQKGMPLASTQNRLLILLVRSPSTAPFRNQKSHVSL